MKPITKLYLKTFLFTGVPYGLIILGFDIADGDGFRLWKFLFMTFFFGIIMSLILVSFHKRRLKENGIHEITDENLGVSQTKNFRTELSKSELIEKLKNDPLSRKMKLLEVENGILLKTTMSWKSWGEKIEIILKSVQKPEFEYQVTSSSRFKITLIDYGKNLENINRIQNLIKSIA